MNSRRVARGGDGSIDCDRERERGVFGFVGRKCVP